MSGPTVKFVVVIIAAIILLNPGCAKKPAEPVAQKGFYLEEFQILIPYLHGFERGRPARHDAREMLLLTRGDGLIWLSRFDNMLTSTDIDVSLREIWDTTQERIYNASYLKGIRLSPLMIKKHQHPTRPYLEQLIIAERTPELFKLMGDIERELRAVEIERFPAGRKMLLANYYTPLGKDVYALSFAAPPEDFLFWVEGAKKIFFEIEFQVPERPPGY